MGNVQVDRDFVRFGSKSYATNKINSIDVRVHRPHSEDKALLFGVATLGLIGFSLSTRAYGYLAIAAVLGVITFLLWDRAQQREYQLFLMLSSTEAQAFVSPNQDEVLALRDRIEAAMTDRAGT